MASVHIQYWALTLSAYDYDIVSGSQQANPDVLSRILLPNQPSTVPLTQETVLLMETLICYSQTNQILDKP